ncbi:MAG: hypothetical protein ACRDB0_03460 [Paraclostridium sp.]
MIDIIYLYPQYKFLGNEINIIRIIDNEIKETITIYAIDKKKSIDIYMSNTSTGENILINKISSIEEIDLLIKRLINEESNIKNEKYLSSVEKYILKNHPI